jgi:hypothetical protein
MGKDSNYRGHKIEKNDDGNWIYSDNKQLVSENSERGCGNCGKAKTKDGYDGCIGWLPSRVVMNACCGHGDKNLAYIQFWDRECLIEDKALEVIEQLKNHQGRIFYDKLSAMLKAQEEE